MEDNSFVISTMQWSFSRINNFYSGCPREWKAHYIDCEETCDSFDGQAGSAAHETLEAFFKGEISEFEMSDYFADKYKQNVTLQCPYPNGDTKFSKIMEYFDNFSFDHNKYEILGVEKKVNFSIGGNDCVGYIDLLLRNKETNEIIIQDHKTSTIKILKSGKVSKYDELHFDAFKKQLYLYSSTVLNEYGRVDKLMWNMLKDGTYIEIPWKEEEYYETIKWAEDTINSINKEQDFPANPSYYYCSNLCSVRRNMNCPYKRLGMIYDGIKSKCYNPKNKYYEEYGAQGIELDETWKENRQEFFNWALENGYSDNMVLKRYDESGNFDFFNCYWGVNDDEEYYNPEYE